MTLFSENSSNKKAVEINTPRLVQKRDHTVVTFDSNKITAAIAAALRAVNSEDNDLAAELSRTVTAQLSRIYSGDNYPTIEDIQNIVEQVLMDTRNFAVAKAYILYRDKRAEAREKMRVRKELTFVNDKDSKSTDIHLMVDKISREELVPWERQRIADALEVEAGLSAEIATSVAKAVEKRIIASGISRVPTSFIRELVDIELFERNLDATLKKQTVIGLPKYDIECLIQSKSNENSNIGANNPEAINLTIAETVLKQYALQEVYDEAVAAAHREGWLHIHDLGYPTRVYCSSHSLEYLKKYGLQLENLDTSSAPARHARTLTGHLNTFLASMQAYYAGALGVAYINIMYAPFVENMSAKEMRQEAQHLIFSSSQNAFSRGGQTLFLDFNIHTGIPNYLANVPAIGPGGQYTGRNYSDYADAATRFTRAMLEVWSDGDQHHNVFAFPKCDFHINQDTFDKPEQYEVLKFACQVAAKNGTPYFIFDRDEVTLSACCRLRTVIEDRYMIEHPESMRFCGFQNVTINLPQCAFRAGQGEGAEQRFFQELDKCTKLAVQAHLDKKQFISQLMYSKGKPLWQVGKPAADGKPYIDLDTATYIVGLIGLNEAVHYLYGHELHDNDEALYQGLRIISFLNFAVKEEGEKHKMKFTLEESPAESASRRFAKIDLRKFPGIADRYIRGNLSADQPYYTNSIHLRPDTGVDLITRIRDQAKFHGLIESGAIIHAFVGEHLPSAEAIEHLVHKTFTDTLAAQLTISPEFSICQVCKKNTPGEHNVCPNCGATAIGSRYTDNLHGDMPWDLAVVLNFSDQQKTKETR